MTQNKKEKQAARALAQREGISYTAALRIVREKAQRDWELEHDIPLGGSTGPGDD